MAMVCATQYIIAPKFIQNQHLFSSTPKFTPYNSTIIHIKRSKRFKLCCNNNKHQHQTFNGFSLLEPDPPWESGSVWSTMGLYIFCLHIPLSFGGLSILSYLLHHHHLDPQFKVAAILVIETLELFSALLLLQFTAKHKPVSFFQLGKLQNERNWVFTALLGFIVLVLAMYFTSFLADQSDATEGMNTPIVKEILCSGTVAQIACVLVYCVVTPLLEEVVYRRFLLASLAPTMEWHQAVVLSSVIFSASHLSAENFIPLVTVGIVLGLSYCWTGDLRSSILLHSMYNALTLLIIILS